MFNGIPFNSYNKLAHFYRWGNESEGSLRKVSTPAGLEGTAAGLDALTKSTESRGWEWGLCSQNAWSQTPPDTYEPGDFEQASSLCVSIFSSVETEISVVRISEGCGQD